MTQVKAILRLPDLVSETGLSKTSIWRRVKDRTFPEPVKLGGPTSRAVGWRREDIETWLANLKCPATVKDLRVGYSENDQSD